MTASVRRTDPKPNSRVSRFWAVCSEHKWHGYRYETESSAEHQARKHNREKHP